MAYARYKSRHPREHSRCWKWRSYATTNHFQRIFTHIYTCVQQIESVVAAIKFNKGRSTRAIEFNLLLLGWGPSVTAIVKWSHHPYTWLLCIVWKSNVPQYQYDDRFVFGTLLEGRRASKRRSNTESAASTTNDFFKPTIYRHNATQNNPIASELIRTSCLLSCRCFLDFKYRKRTWPLVSIALFA